MAVSSTDIVQRVQTMLRRDLKLGPDVQISPAMPFFVGDIDLDSLDILLLVTSVEKEFGVKIPSSEIGKEVFQDVTTLTNYIASQAGKTPDAGSLASASAALTADPLTQLPHGEPFRFVSSVSNVKPGESAEGAWN